MDAAKRHGGGGVLAAPLMDLSRMDEVSVSGSTMLPAAAACSADAVVGLLPGDPPTSRLIAVDPSRPLMAPDLCKLFTLYYHDGTVKAPEPKALQT